MATICQSYTKNKSGTVFFDSKRSYIYSIQVVNSGWAGMMVS